MKYRLLWVFKRSVFWTAMNMLNIKNIANGKL